MADDEIQLPAVFDEKPIRVRMYIASCCLLIIGVGFGVCVASSMALEDCILLYCVVTNATPVNFECLRGIARVHTHRMSWIAS